LRNRNLNDRFPRQIRRVAVVPSLVTLVNAVCGFASIHFASKGMNDPNALWWLHPPLTYFAASAWMIFFAMVADAMDGWIARMARSSSSFGGQLDSLADVISFGAAPAFLMLRMVETSIHEIQPASPIYGSIPGRLVWLIAAAYLCCAALRLARFNVENAPDETAHLEFKGLPSPAAAGVVAALALLQTDLFQDYQEGFARPLVIFGTKWIIYLLPFITLAAALLMVSRIRYPHVMNLYVRGRKPFSYVVWLVLTALLLNWQLQLTLAISFSAFAISGIARWAWAKYVRKVPETPWPKWSHNRPPENQEKLSQL
jgi:CDP-diacylglycerol---serine O-phosphatidyltransferase